MKNRIKELDALRGISALIVVLFHLTKSWDAAKYGFQYGWVGVELFFIISGFVIFMSLEKCASWQEFLVRRFSRLFPAYWVGVTLTALVIYGTILLGINQDKEDNLMVNYLFNLTMLHYYFNIPNLDSPYWTLVVELGFYFFMLLLFITKSLKHIEKIGFLFLCLVFPFGIFHENILANHYLSSIAFAFPLIAYFPLFFIGILFYRIRFKEVNIKRILLIIFSCISQVLMFETASKFKGFISFPEYLMLFSVIMLLFVLFSINKLDFIINRFTSRLGDISYSLYLIHNYIGIKLMLYLQKYFGINLWIGLGIALIIVIGLAFLINRFIEKPALHFIRNRYRKKID